MKTPDAIPASNSARDHAPARLIVDLAALAENYATLQRLTPSAETGAVVKADAYGLDAARITRTLAGAGCRSFFTATPAEGAAVRAALGSTDAAIFVLNGYWPHAAALYREAGLTPVLNALEELSAYAQAGGGPCGLHIDTGLNRLGLSETDVAGLMPGEGMLAGCTLALVMSHLACADEPASAMNARQLARFIAASARFGDVPRSLANTGGVLLGPDYHFDLTRPGIGLYGVNPATETPAPFTPVLHVDAPLLQVRAVRAGDTVGYGARWQAQRPSTIAIAAMGYADGLMRAARQGGYARLGGQPVPIVGAVSMDLTALDITGHEELASQLGRVQFYGADLGPVAGAAGTIGYELLTRLGGRLERAYPEEKLTQ
ncbi:MAG: alanine racemase [Glycocaulis sp.]